MRGETILGSCLFRQRKLSSITTVKSPRSLSYKQDLKLEFTFISRVLCLLLKKTMLIEFIFVSGDVF